LRNSSTYTHITNAAFDPFWIMSLCCVTFSLLKEWPLVGNVLLSNVLFVFRVLLMVLLALHSVYSFGCLKKFVAFRFFTYISEGNTTKCRTSKHNAKTYGMYIYSKH